MQAVCSTSATSFKGISLARKATRGPAARAACRVPAARVACTAEQKPVAKIVAAAASLPALLAAHPALALVDDRLGGEGTGKILGVGGAEGWGIFLMFGLIWALFFTGSRGLGGDKGDDSGLTL